MRETTICLSRNSSNRADQGVQGPHDRRPGLVTALRQNSVRLLLDLDETLTGRTRPALGLIAFPKQLGEPRKSLLSH